MKVDWTILFSINRSAFMKSYKDVQTITGIVPCEKFDILANIHLRKGAAAALRPPMSLRPHMKLSNSVMGEAAHEQAFELRRILLHNRWTASNFALNSRRVTFQHPHRQHQPYAACWESLGYCLRS